jgi:nucleoside triphosphate diphosphatase
LKEELGDLLLQVVFHATIAKEKGDFTLDEVAEGITKKLILRHPHVFGDAKMERAQDVLDNWDELKKNERRASGKKEKQNDSILEEVPIHFPGLLEASKVTKEAAKVGFDWESSDQVFEKIDEEVAELKTEIETNDKKRIENEIGDLLFAVVNLARKLDVEPETALKLTNRKFRRRFAYIERSLKDQERTLDATSLGDLDALWNEAKANE